MPAEGKGQGVSWRYRIEHIGSGRVLVRTKNRGVLFASREDGSEHGKPFPTCRIVVTARFRDGGTAEAIIRSPRSLFSAQAKLLEGGPQAAPKIVPRQHALFENPELES